MANDLHAAIAGVLPGDSSYKLMQQAYREGAEAMRAACLVALAHSGWQQDEMGGRALCDGMDLISAITVPVKP